MDGLIENQVLMMGERIESLRKNQIGCGPDLHQDPPPLKNTMVKAIEPPHYWL